MARKSRKVDYVNVGNKENLVTEAENQCEKVSHAALYARLSYESEKNRERNTIETQMVLLHNFVKEQKDIVVAKEYYDISKTGTNFERDEVYEILQNQKIKQTEQKMWKRSIWKQHKEFQNLVFTCSDGSPVYYYNVNSAIKDYVAKINVIEIELAKEEKREPKIFELFTCHTLRHTYATRCYENGVDQQVVQKLLGHSTLAMTTDLYTHVSEEKKKEEVAELKILA